MFPTRHQDDSGYVYDSDSDEIPTTEFVSRRVIQFTGIVLTGGAFLSAWAASNFALDYRAVLWAVLAGVFGYATPKK